MTIMTIIIRRRRLGRKGQAILSGALLIQSRSGTGQFITRITTARECWHAVRSPHPIGPQLAGLAGITLAPAVVEAKVMLSHDLRHRANEARCSQIRGSMGMKVIHRAHSTLLIATLSTLGAYACGGSDTAAPEPNGPVVATVTVTPTTDSLGALGATALYTAVSKDRDGNLLSNVRVEWSSSAPSVATISPSGMTTAIGNGTTTITAQSALRGRPRRYASIKPSPSCPSCSCATSFQPLAIRCARPCAPPTHAVTLFPR